MPPMAFEESEGTGSEILPDEIFNENMNLKQHIAQL